MARRRRSRWIEFADQPLERRELLSQVPAQVAGDPFHHDGINLHPYAPA